MKSYRSTRLIIFIVLMITIITYEYNSVENSVKEETYDKIKTTLDTHQAIRQFVRHIQRPNIEALRNEGVIDSDLFLPQLESSSYITARFQKFLDQTVQFKDYALQFRYASLSPLNANFQASDRDKKLIQKFDRNEITKYEAIEKTPNGKEFIYALPSERITQECLSCHGTPQDAPNGLVHYYGDSSGFNHPLGKINALFAFQMPIDDLLKEAYARFYKRIITIFIILLILYLFIEAFIHRIAKNRSLESKTNELTQFISTLNQHVISTQTDLHGTITDASDAFCQISGYSKEELIGSSHNIVRHPETLDSTYQKMWEKIKNDEPWIGELHNLTKTGDSFWINAIILPLHDKENKKSGYLSIKQDISETKRIQDIANHDHLTNLLNRHTFEASFAQEVKRAARDKKILSFIMIDIDHFKKYNDYYGHPNGDLAIQKIATALQEHFLRPHDFIFRLGGEEFGVITSGVSQKDIKAFLKSFIAKIEALEIEHLSNLPYNVLTISVGVDQIQDGETKEITRLIKNADDALYKAKNNGKNCVIIYEESIKSDTNE
jgi:diguanylate cyclase (GGDEF)-like protein/PAS domain S-box-containing protein